MNTLPPLRTVRGPGTPAAPAPGRAFDTSTLPPHLPTALRDVLQDLLDLKLADPPAVRQFLAGLGPKANQLTQRDRVGQTLTQAGVLTAYQRDRVLAGSTFGLVLGNYRVLDRLSGGSVGVVFLGEHVYLRRRVAMKVLPVEDGVRPDLLDRFHAEMRVLASLDHPHVVAAHDAGVAVSPVPGQPALHYLVLELVPGGDIEQYVYDHGPRPVGQACEWARQAAAGLQAAHDRHLIHRDLKPSNVLLAADGTVKVVDFGLARQLASTMTKPTTLLGSVEFMPPEQSLDPTAVGPAADVYGLGATLFWTLTGQLPFARGRTVAESVQALVTGRPRRLREFRPDVPAELDAFVDRMLARDPLSRPSAVQVMTGLARFAVACEAAESPSSDADRLRLVVRQLEGSLRTRDGDARRAENTVLFALSRLVVGCDGETVGHGKRMQEYVRLLVAELADHPDWPVLHDGRYVDQLVRCVPLHDIGKVGLSPGLLVKPSALSHDERAAVEGHPAAGCAVLDAVGSGPGDWLPFLSVARGVIRSHHERWDGTGYPDKLAAADIPPAARLVALADVYDALRNDRPYRPALSHADAVTTIVERSAGQFDPSVVEAFGKCAAAFDAAFGMIGD